jgi:hypothetical protein
MLLIKNMGEKMLYPYIELPDGTIITHSELKKDNSVLINFEQPFDQGFHEARIVLPSYKWLYNEGFDEQQVKFFNDFARKNAAVIYKYARLGGIANA